MRILGATRLMSDRLQDDEGFATWSPRWIRPALMFALTLADTTWCGLHGRLLYLPGKGAVTVGPVEPPGCRGPVLTLVRVMRDVVVLLAVVVIATWGAAKLFGWDVRRTWACAPLIVGLPLAASLLMLLVVCGGYLLATVAQSRPSWPWVSRGPRPPKVRRRKLRNGGGARGARGKFASHMTGVLAENDARSIALYLHTYNDTARQAFSRSCFRQAPTVQTVWGMSRWLMVRPAHPDGPCSTTRCLLPSPF